MKTKFQNFIALFLILGVVSCSSDDDASPSETTPAGNWMLTSLRIETAFDFNNDGTASRNLFEETPCYNGDFVTLNADGTARVVTSLTYIYADVVSATDYSYNYECQDGYDVDTVWDQKNDMVIVHYGATNLQGSISGNTMTVVIPDFFNIEMYNGTNYYDVQEDVTLTYTKG
tara:strand:- start:611 stop:1129 length:519 start_codon:yes stop_codon:yes gene_type:complete